MYKLCAGGVWGLEGLKESCKLLVRMTEASDKGEVGRQLLYHAKMGT